MIARCSCVLAFVHVLQAQQTASSADVAGSEALLLEKRLLLALGTYQAKTVLE